MYEKNSRELDTILEEAEGRGSNEFFTILEKRIEKLSDDWSTNEMGGDLSHDEITRLIERKHYILERIKALKLSNKQLK